LQRFAGQRDEAAFATLVRRHGPMVLRLGRRLLRHEHDAEDVLQATFLVLARKAGSVRRRASLASWLYGVASRIAMNAKRKAVRRHAHESRPPRQAVADPLAHMTVREAQDIFDQELARLPEKYRAPLVLCCLEGLARDEAARQVGLPQQTLKSRLEQGRALLRKRLAARGLTISAALLSAWLGEGAAAAAVPAVLVNATVHAAARFAGGSAAAAVASAKVATLTQGAIRNMLLTKLKHGAGLSVLAALAITATVHLSGVLAQEKKSDPPAAQAKQPKPPTPAPASSEPGRIGFHRNFELTSLLPDGTDAKQRGQIPPAHLLGYQSHQTRFSPDGKWIAFGKAVIDNASVGPPSTVYLWEIGQAAPPEPLVEMAGLEFHSWIWSPDGKKLAICSWDKNHSVRNWVVDIKTKKVEEIKMPRFKHGDKEYTMAVQAWSPDGAWLLANGNGLHLIKLDGSASRRLTRSESKNLLGGTCRFSPDGRRILYTGVHYKEGEKPQRHQTLYVVDLADGKVRPVVEAKNFGCVHACWSLDSRRIAYCVRLLDADGNCAGETSIFACDADGANTVTVVTEQHEPDVIWLRLIDWQAEKR
jgi:RNA polymerase sigma factor (sigma-70 family)